MYGESRVTGPRELRNAKRHQSRPPMSSALYVAVAADDWELDY